MPIKQAAVPGAFISHLLEFYTRTIKLAATSATAHLLFTLNAGNVQHRSDGDAIPSVSGSSSHKMVLASVHPMSFEGWSLMAQWHNLTACVICQ